MPKAPVSEEDMDLILNMLERGKHNSKSARYLANEANLRSDKTDIHIRSIISALIEDGWPIGSWSGGFFIISSVAELREVVDGLKARSSGILERMNKVMDNFRRRR